MTSTLEPTAVPSSSVDVCIFIDPLFDFLSPSGVFCKTYGEEDCAPIMSVRSSLNQLYQHLKMNCPAVDIIIVSSVYEATQFETVPNLCTTAEGCMVLLDDCPVDENNQICESLERILQLVRNRTVLVCGVTTVSCVSMAVSNLRKNAFCNKVLIARDAVASRKSNASREADLLLEWVAATTSEGVANIEVYDHWQRLMFAE